MNLRAWAPRVAPWLIALAAALRANDSYHFFEAIGGLYKTGPTRTNVCDLHLLLVE